MAFKKGGVPPSPAGEAFWNFHVAGVVIVFLLWGVLLRIMWKSVAASRMPGIVTLYLVTLYYLKPHTVAVSGWLRVIVPAVLVLMLFSLTIGQARGRSR